MEKKDQKNESQTSTDNNNNSVKRGTTPETEMKSNRILSAPRSISASTAGQADCLGFQTTPLTGSGILRTVNPLYAAMWNTPTGS